MEIHLPTEERIKAFLDKHLKTPAAKTLRTSLADRTDFYSLFVIEVLGAAKDSPNFLALRQFAKDFLFARLYGRAAEITH
jgi:hypothetical protein